MLRIGHRGACGHAPENTLASFQKALDLGCDAVELDVHLCKSGEAVVIHDDTLERTTSGKGKVAEHTLAELKTLNAGEGEKISTLAEVLHFIHRRMKVFIELKTDATSAVARAIGAAVLQDGWHYDQLPVISFNHALLKKIKTINPVIITGATFEGYPADLSATQGMNAICPSKDIVDAALMEASKAQGLAVYVWTANKPQDIERIKSLGVDGIISDFPERL